MSNEKESNKPITPDWMEKYRKVRDRPRVLENPDYFVEGSNYYALCMGGSPETTYKLIFKNKHLLVFLFEYQGIQRTHTCYLHETYVGDYSLIRSY